MPALPDLSTLQPVEEKTLPDFSTLAPLEEESPSPQFPKVTLSPYQRADLESIGQGRGKAATGMEAGTDFTTAAATGAITAPSRIANWLDEKLTPKPRISPPELSPEAQEWANVFEQNRKKEVSEGTSTPRTAKEWFMSGGPHGHPLKIGPDDPVVASAAKEMVNLIGGSGQFVMQPVGAAAVAASALPGGAAAVRLAFAADMTKGLFEQAPALYHNWDKLTPSQRTAALVDIAGTAGMLKMLTNRGTKADVTEAMTERTGKLAPDVIRLTPEGRPVLGMKTLPMPSGGIPMMVQPPAQASEELTAPTIADVRFGQLQPGTGRQITMPGGATPSPEAAVAAAAREAEFQKTLERKAPNAQREIAQTGGLPAQRRQPVVGPTEVQTQAGTPLGVRPREAVAPQAPTPEAGQERVLLGSFLGDLMKTDVPQSTNLALKAGLEVKTTKDLDTLLELRTRMLQEGARMMSEAGKFPKNTPEWLDGINKGAALMTKSQLPSEAIQAALNVSSAVEGEGTIPLSLGPRPMDWRTHPEVADWLRKNGERLGIVLPDELKAAPQPPAPAEAPALAPAPEAPPLTLEQIHKRDVDRLQAVQAELATLKAQRPKPITQKEAWLEGAPELEGQSKWDANLEKRIGDLEHESYQLETMLKADEPAPAPAPEAPEVEPVEPEQRAAETPKEPEFTGKAIERPRSPGAETQLEYRHAGIPIPGAEKVSAVLESWLKGVFNRVRSGPDEPMPSRRRLAADVVDRLFGPEAGETTDALTRQIAGESAPKTMAASRDSGNALVRFASATVAAPHVARSLSRDVLGDNWQNAKFREWLGGVLVEDRLRAIRKGLQDAAAREADPIKAARLNQEAGKVNTLVGPGKLFPNEASFLHILRGPKISAAIARHKETVQVQAQRFHSETGGQLAGPGLNTGAFVNLLPVFEDSPGTVFLGSTKGDYTRPFKRKSVFSRQAKGTAEKYALDYGLLAERMIRGNFEEHAKRQLYSQLVSDGLAVVRGPGEPRPTFEDKPAVKFQILRRGGAPGQTVIENLWVRPDIAPELRAAENLDGPIRGAAFSRVANVLNAIQLAGPTDAVWHIANMMSSIASAQGGKNVLVDIGRKVPLANVVDATTRVTLAARNVLRNNPEVLRQISELSEIGAMRPERASGGLNSRIINLLDKAGRVVRDDLYQNLVKRGLVEASEEGRREFVNQMGQYNPRLMGQFQAFFKEAGLAPFIVAGRNFNRQALRRVTFSPGIRSATIQGAIQMRAIEAFGVLSTLIVVPAVLNSISVGTPGGRSGVPLGGIDTGKTDSNGKPIYVDPAQWIGLRRGMRLTGMNAVIEGMREGQTNRQISGRAGRDIIGAAVHPWAGPSAQAPVITGTGYTTSFYKESQDPGDYWENFKAAIKNINPLIHGWFSQQPSGGKAGLGGAVKSLGGAAGIKTAPQRTANQQINQLFVSWMDKSLDPKIRHQLEVRQQQSFGESDYKQLRTALIAGDTALSSKAYDALLSDKGKTTSEVRSAVSPFNQSGGMKPLTGSAKHEAEFRDSLTAKQLELYDKARDERVLLYERFKDMLSTAQSPRGSETNPLPDFRTLQPVQQ